MSSALNHYVTSTLCETESSRRQVFSLVIAAVGLDVAKVCINYYQLVKFPASSKEDITFIVTILYWCITCSDRNNSLYCDVWSESQRKGKNLTLCYSIFKSISTYNEYDSFFYLQ